MPLAQEVILVATQALQLLLEDLDEIGGLHQNGDGFADSVESVACLTLLGAQIERSAVDLGQRPRAREGRRQRTDGHRWQTGLGRDAPGHHVTHLGRAAFGRDADTLALGIAQQVKDSPERHPSHDELDLQFIRATKGTQ